MGITDRRTIGDTWDAVFSVDDAVIWHSSGKAWIVALSHPNNIKRLAMAQRSPF
jgi:hypothetical protein